MRVTIDQQRAARAAEEIVYNAMTRGVFPAAALRVHQIVGQTGATLRDLESAVRADRALCAMLLRDATQGPTYGGAVKLSDVLLKLGVPATRDLAFALSFARAASSSEGRSRGLWHHMLRTACIAAAMATDLRSVRRSEAFQAGLGLDLGVVAMLEAGPDDYGELLAEVGGSLLGLDALEWERYGFDHAQIGDLYLRQLGFSHAVCTAVLRHHSDGQGALTAVVSLADAIDTGLRMGLQPEDVAEDAMEHAANGVLRRSVRQLRDYAATGVREADSYIQRVGF
jgi:HD-like signal output (HDOD) protein